MKKGCKRLSERMGGTYAHDDDIVDGTGHVAVFLANRVGFL